jgi:hypothetical protein
MFSASVNKPCNSSTVVDHGMLPTYKRLDCGCSVDMVFVFIRSLVRVLMETRRAIQWRLLSWQFRVFNLGSETLNCFEWIP